MDKTHLPFKLKADMISQVDGKPWVTHVPLMLGENENGKNLQENEEIELRERIPRSSAAGLASTK